MSGLCLRGVSSNHSHRLCSSVTPLGIQNSYSVNTDLETCIMCDLVTCSFTTELKVIGVCFCESIGKKKKKFRQQTIATTATQSINITGGTCYEQKQG